MLKKKNETRKRLKVFNYMTKIAILSAISFVLYLITFPIPGFPPFLKVQFSNLPVILGTFMLGPLGGVLISLIKTVIALPTSGTGMVGELADFLISIAIVIPSGFLYKETRSKTGGLLSIIVAVFMWIVGGVLTNYFINIPFYSKVMGMDAIVKACSAIYPGVTEETFMKTYILYGVIPFNAIVAIVVCLVTFLVYKRVSDIFKKDFIKSKNAPRVLVCCDSFKGTMSSKKVCKIVAEELNKNGFDAIERVISDGGEGFLEAISAGRKGLTKIKIKVDNAIGKLHKTYYLFDNVEKLAYIEMAKCCGIQELAKNELDVMHCSSFGLGQAIEHAVVQNGAKKVIIGLGGSASNDGGTGLLEALGVEFFNAERFHMQDLCGEKLNDISTIDFTSLDKYKDVEFECLTDVKNELLGYSGATYVFGPQKGATRENLVQLEEGMSRFASLTESILNGTYKNIPGVGAAGGVGFALAAYLHAKVKSGIAEVLSISDIKNLINTVDYVVTGEGCLDDQSLNGKVISGIISCKPKDLSFVVGQNKIDMDYVYPVVPTVCTFEESIANPSYYLRKLVDKTLVKDLSKKVLQEDNENINAAKECKTE